MLALLQKVKLLQQISVLESEVEKLDVDIEYFHQMDPLEALAIHLHDQRCKQNHQDGCSWTFEINTSPDNNKVNVHDWDKSAHKNWHEKCKPLYDHLLENHITVEEYLQILLLTP